MNRLERQFKSMWNDYFALKIRPVKAKKPKKQRVRSLRTAYARRKARELECGPGWTSNEWLELCSKYSNQCLKCGSSQLLVPDHVIPLKRGGVHHISNIQPLCNKCNIRKGLTFDG